MRSNRGGVLSAVLAFAFSGGMNFQVQPETPRLSMKDYDILLQHGNKRHARNKSSAINQRQIRKNKRRRHAAGFKNAFK